MELSRFRAIGLNMSFTVGSPFSFLTLLKLADNSNWDPATFTIADAKEAEDQNPFDIATWNGNISAFQNNGGKIRRCSPFP
jgi:feruloyl esterase